MGWGNLNAVETLGYSRYNAMMLRLSRRFANNLSVNFNYTYSKIMDIVDNDSDTINNPFNIRQNYAPAGYDQPNVATLDFVYMLPKVKGSLDQPILRQAFNGWELSGMIRSQSGMPLTITSNGNLMGVNAGTPVRQSHRRRLRRTEQLPMAQPGCLHPSGGWLVRHPRPGTRSACRASGTWT